MNGETGVHLICRLCGKDEKYLIDIFSDDGKKQSLDKKIRLCLPICVTVDDEMPRQVCLDCLNKLDVAYELYIGCIYAQHDIRKKLSYKRESASAVTCTGALQSGFLSDSNSISGKNTTTDNSLRSMLGLQRTFSSYVSNELKTLNNESLQRMCLSNMPTQVNASSSNGQLLGTQLDGTSIMLTAASVPMMQATNSPMTGNPQGQLYVPSLSNSVNPAATMASPSIPVVVSPQFAPGSCAQMSTSCNKPQYPIQNNYNLPSSVQIMPVAQMQTGSSDRPSHFASAVYHTQHPSMPQNGVPMVQVMDREGQMQMQMQPPPSSSVPMTRTPAGSGTLPGLSANTLFDHIPSPSHSVPVVPATNATQMQPPRDRQPNQQNFDNLMHQTVSLWASKQNAAVNSVGSAQSRGGSQTSAVSDCPTVRTSLFTNPAMSQENGCAAGPFQPVITQVTAGFQDAAAVQTDHVDLSKDSDDDMDAEPGPDAPDESENKPFSLSIVTSPQRKTHRKRPTNSLAMEECPHCHKEFRSDIIFHHVKLHFRQSFFSCLDCGKNYSSEKALEAHKCSGENV